MNKMIWVTWEKQLRNRSMSEILKIPLFEISSERTRSVRYTICIIRTVLLLLTEKPSVVICQCPSVVLVLLLLGLKQLVGFRVVVDAHYAGIISGVGNTFFQRILEYCNRSADLTIVTNENHAHRVRSLGGRAFVCPDPIPDLSQYYSFVEKSQKILLICSYDPDEPFQEVFKAAKDLTNGGFRIAVSGKYKKAKILPDNYPYVQFLGFLPEKEFYRHLFSSQVIIDLTNNDDCLVCGAYEALSAGKPLILSKKETLLNYFTEGTVFTENNARDIAGAVRIAYAERKKLARASRLWVKRAKVEMNERITDLKKIIDSL
jgi:glycosyltransferase involved in cell wall biosynthesis